MAVQLNIEYEKLIELVEQLPEIEQNKLIYHLRTQRVAQKTKTQVMPAQESEPIHDEWYAERGSEYVDYYRNPTREQLIDELNDLRAAGVFDDTESLYGKYANPDAPEMSEEDTHAELHAIATEWEQELDELNADNN